MSLICSSEYLLRPIEGRRRPGSRAGGSAAAAAPGPGGGDRGARGRLGGRLSARGSSPSAWDASAQRLAVYVTPRAHCRTHRRGLPPRSRSGLRGLDGRREGASSGVGIGVARAGARSAWGLGAARGLRFPCRGDHCTGCRWDLARVGRLLQCARVTREAAAAGLAARSAAPRSPRAKAAGIGVAFLGFQLSGLVASERE